MEKELKEKLGNRTREMSKWEKLAIHPKILLF